MKPNKYYLRLGVSTLITKFFRMQTPLITLTIRFVYQDWLLKFNYISFLKNNIKSNFESMWESPIKLTSKSCIKSVISDFLRKCLAMKCFFIPMNSQFSNLSVERNILSTIFILLMSSNLWVAIRYVKLKANKIVYEKVIYPINVEQTISDP